MFGKIVPLSRRAYSYNPKRHKKGLKLIKQVRYAFFDGDNIGNTIDNLLKSGRVEEAAHLSETIKIALFKVEIFVKSTENARIIISGGDDILIEYSPERLRPDFIHFISQIFMDSTGLSISCGIGSSVVQAIRALENIKEKGKGQIEFNANENVNEDSKKARLFIFTASGVPDPYINVIGHGIINHPSLLTITLVSIVGDRGKVKEEEEKLESLHQDIRNQLKCLAHGKYRKKTGKNWEEKEIEISSIYRRMYSEWGAFLIEEKVVVHEDLEEFMLELSRTTNSCQNIIDVTAALKSYLVDIYSLARFHKISTIHSFELFSEKRTYDDSELIHNLNFRKTYGYPCLSESPHTKDKIVVKETLASSTINEVFDRFEDKISSDFARFWSLIYVLGWTPVVVVVIHYLGQPDGWDKVEPFAFLVTFIWYLLNCILQAVFTGRFPSLDPTNLFYVLKEWKKEKIRKSRPRG